MRVHATKDRLAPAGRVLAVVLATVFAIGLDVGAPRRVEAAATLPQGFEATDYVSIGQRLTAMAWSPDGRLFVSEKTGGVRVVKNGNLLPTPFLTVTTNTNDEKGLKGVAFDPNFGSNGYVYVYYTDADTLLNKVSRFTTSSGNPDVADPNSEIVLISGIGSGVYHSAGALHFGPDGKLYISTGDASYAPDSQNLHNLNGKILRINKDGTVPTDNPFVGQTGVRPEIWAYGLRNPFTFAFSSTGLMYINDVGNSTWEEIDQGQKGANYGWPTCEGVCNVAGMTNPIYTYNHNDGPGKSITGAEFYSGTTFPTDYRGDYFFGDYVGNYIKRYDPATGQVFDFAVDVPNPVDLRTGPDGALYYLAVEAKKVVRIQYTGVVTPPPDPNTVSFAPVADDHVTAASPAKNYGRSPSLYAQSGADANRIFKKWDLSSLAGKVIDSATLKFRTSTTASSASSATENVKLVTDSSWTELGLTWNNQPAMSTGLATIPAVAANTNYSITLPVNALQPYAGTLLSLGIDANNPVDSMYFNSRDAVSDRPALVIHWSDPAPPVIGDPPQPSIDTPVDGSTFRANDTISFSGSATDTEDGTLGPSAMTWEVVFHHDTHTHPFIEPFSGVDHGTFDIPDTGEASDNIWYRIHLTVTDSDGNTATTFRDVVPLKSTVTLATSPSGLQVLLDGSPFTAPKTFIGVENFKRQITAPLTQSMNGRTYEFVSWSDGGAADHSIQTPINDTTYTATYKDVTDSGTEAVSDDFTRTVTNGWGTADKGGTYVLSGGNANFAATGSAATILLPQTNANKAATLPGVYLQDADVTVRVAEDKLPVGNAGYAYAEVRVAGSNAYRPKLIFNTNGTVAVHAGVVVNGTETQVAPPVVVAGLTQTPGAFYWLRTQVTGVNPTTIKVKAWADGQPEPANWQFSATNNAAQLQTAGAVGLRAYTRSTNAPVTYTFDDYNVIGQPPTAPPPQGTNVAADAFDRNTTNAWGTADTGGSYTLEGAAGAYFVTDDEGGSMRMGAPGATRVAYLPGVSATDVDARVKITADKSTVAGNWYAYIQLRRNGTSAFQPKIIVNANGTVSVQAGALVNGTESSLGAAVVVPGLTFTPGTEIWLRAQVSGTNPTTIKVKAWLDGQAEPVNWQFSATSNAAALQTAGSVGLRTYAGSQVTNTPLVVTFDDFAVTATN
jgi:glucose/arabinose dehydrogenase